MGPRNRFQGMNSASLAGRSDNPLPPRFLDPIASLKIPAPIFQEELKRAISWQQMRKWGTSKICIVTDDNNRIDSNDKKCECVFFLVSLRIPPSLPGGAAALWLHEDPVAPLGCGIFTSLVFLRVCTLYSIMYSAFSSLLMYHISFVQAFFYKRRSLPKKYIKHGIIYVCVTPCYSKD